MQLNEYDKMFAFENDYWWYRGLQELVESRIRMIRIGKRLTSLDAGCGTGRCAQVLEPYGTVEVIDYSPAAVDYCESRGLKNCPVRARDKEPMKDGKEHRSLDIEPDLPFRRKATDHALDPELFPQSPEDERRPDLSGVYSYVALARQDQQRLLRVAGERPDECLDFSFAWRRSMRPMVPMTRWTTRDRSLRVSTICRHS